MLKIFPFLLGGKQVAPYFCGRYETQNDNNHLYRHGALLRLAALLASTLYESGAASTQRAFCRGCEPMFELRVAQHGDGAEPKRFAVLHEGPLPRGRRSVVEGLYIRPRGIYGCLPLDHS